MSSSRAPISSARRSRSEFRDTGADRLDAEHQMVVGTGDDPHEALLGRFGQRTAIGGKGVLADPISRPA